MIEKGFPNEVVIDYSVSDENPFLKMKKINEFIITEKILIMDSICRYKHFLTYVQKTIHHILDHKMNLFEPSNDLIDLIVVLMRKHIDVQIISTVFLHQLTQNELKDNIDLKRLEKVVEVILNAMELLPNHEILQNFALLTLLNDRILKSV